MTGESRWIVRPIRPEDRGWIAALLAERWGGPLIVTRGWAHHADQLPGFAAMSGGEPLGLLTYHIAGDQCEIISLDSLREGEGIGAALIEAARRTAQEAGCSRLWLITTNDNLPALRFYQKRGFTLAALYPNALAGSRRIKPQISLVGLDGIPLRDEIELEMIL